MADITLTYSDEGLPKLVEFLVNKTAPGNLVLRSFVNDATITEATVLTDLTEATSYTEATLTGATWGAGAYTGGKGSTTYGASVDLDFTGSHTVYGVYLTDAAETYLVGAAKFAVAQPVADGSTITLSSIILTTDNVA